MKLMVSVQNLGEAMQAVEGGADIVDVKNLDEMFVGSNFPPVIKEVRSAIDKNVHVSVTLGVVPNQAGTVALAAYGAATMNASSVKIGFLNTDYEAALKLLKECKKALSSFDTKIIVSTFADSAIYGGIDPKLVVRLAVESKSDGILIDTLTKDGRNLFDFMSVDELSELIAKAKGLGLSTALSGSLKVGDFDTLIEINPDIVGVRGAVCKDENRYKGRVEASAVSNVRAKLNLGVKKKMAMVSSCSGQNSCSCKSDSCKETQSCKG